MDLPLFEDDLSSPGVIEPDATTHGVRVDAMPDTAVLCFFPEVIERLAADGARRVCTFTLESGRTAVVETEVDGRLLAVLQPGVGAPLSTILMEDLIALGVRRFVAVGGAGALLPDLVLGHAVVVDSAVRDEGTSYHYLAPAAVVDADPAGVATLSATLEAAGVPYLRARTWTTDADLPRDPQPGRPAPGRGLRGGGDGGRGPHRGGALPRRRVRSAAAGRRLPRGRGVGAPGMDHRRRGPAGLVRAGREGGRRDVTCRGVSPNWINGRRRSGIG